MGNLGKLKRALRRIESDDSAEIRARAVDAVLAHTQADFGMFVPYVVSEGKVFHGAFTVCGDRTASRQVRALDGAPSLSVGLWDPRRPRRSEKQRFVSIQHGPVSFERVAQSKGYRLIYQPFGIRDHARILLYTGTRFLGWFGLLREEFASFSRRDLDVLDHVVPELTAALAAAEDLEHAAASGEVHVIADPDTLAVEWASRAARIWLRRRARDFEDLLRAFRSGEQVSATYIDSHQVRVVELLGERGMRYHACVCRDESVQLSVDSVLSPRQQEVSRLAAAGATRPEISEILQVSENTVAAHLKAAYEKLDIGTRTELAALLASPDGSSG